MSIPFYFLPDKILLVRNNNFVIKFSKYKSNLPVKISRYGEWCYLAIHVSRGSKYYMCHIYLASFVGGLEQLPYEGILW